MEQLIGYECSPDPTEAQIRALTNMGALALEIMGARYSTGYPEFRGGQRARLGFHNGYHARFVGDTGFMIAEAIGLAPLDQHIVRTDGYIHDIVQQEGCGINEDKCAVWQTDHMEGSGQFSDADIEVGRLGILGTEPIFKNGRLVGQKATEMEYPSFRHERVAKVLASADLGHLYSPMGPYLGHRLYQELTTGDFNNDVLPLSGLINFERSQANLLDTYVFPLSEATPILKTHADEVRKHSDLILWQLENAHILSFNELLRQDLAFARRFG